MGEHTLNNGNNDGAKVIGVREIHEHPDYNSKTTNYDFAILELEKELDFSESVRPACLPQNSSNTYAGSDGKYPQTDMSGHPKSDDLETVNKVESRIKNQITLV